MTGTRPPWAAAALAGAAGGVALGGGWVLAQSLTSPYEDLLTPLVVLSFAGGFAGAWLGLGVVLVVSLARRRPAVRRSFPREAGIAASLGAAGCGGLWFLSWATGLGVDPSSGAPSLPSFLAVGMAAGVLGAAGVRALRGVRGGA